MTSLKDIVVNPIVTAVTGVVNGTSNGVVHQEDTKQDQKPPAKSPKSVQQKLNLMFKHQIFASPLHSYIQRRKNHHGCFKFDYNASVK